MRARPNGAEWRPHGKGRSTAEYRGWRRSNAIRWYGVLRIKEIQQPQLVRNRHGDVNFSVKNNAAFDKD